MVNPPVTSGAKIRERKELAVKERARFSRSLMNVLKAEGYDPADIAAIALIWTKTDLPLKRVLTLKEGEARLVKGEVVVELREAA